MSLLKLEGINTYYGQIHILQDLNLEVNAGELVCLLGGNASGKSTTLKTILGIVRSRTGTIQFNGADVTTRTTSHRIGQGMAIVPENRRLFAPILNRKTPWKICCRSTSSDGTRDWRMPTMAYFQA